MRRSSPTPVAKRRWSYITWGVLSNSSPEHAGGTVVVRDLAKTHLPFIGLPWIAGAYTPAESHSPEMKEALELSNEFIAELMASDHIVIGTPMYNFSVPANLKAYTIISYELASRSR